jgi:hypothetical protein
MKIPKGLTPLLILSCSLLLLSLIVPYEWPNGLIYSAQAVSLVTILWGGQWSMRPKKDQPLRLGALIITLGAAIAWLANLYFLFQATPDQSSILGPSAGSITATLALFLTLGSLLWITIHFHLHPDESHLIPPPIDG